jgi:hypothetical protein
MQYLPQLAPVDESDVLIVNMKAYDLVLGIPWFERHNPDIDWVRKRLITLRNPVYSGIPANALAGSNNSETSSEHEELSPVQNNANESSDIAMISAVEFDCLLATAELSEAYALKLWQGTGLLGGTEHGQEMSLRKWGIDSRTCVAS